MSVVDVTQLTPGQKGKVVNIEGGWGLVSKLEALGIIPGVEVSKVSAQIMRGPVTLQVGNTQVAIGFGMARRIFVETQE